MSNHVSPAQTLPSDTVRLLIQYVVREARHSSGLVTCSMSLLQELLSVCSTWRQSALEYMWREYRIIICESKDIVYNSRPKWFDNYWHPSRTAHLVRELGIHIPWFRLFNGDARKLLAEYMRYTPLLPLAHKIRIVVSDEMGNPDYMNVTANNNVLEFSLLLQSLTPAVSSIDVKFEDGSSSMRKIEERVFGEFLKSLFANSQHTVLDIMELNLGQATTIECIPQLTSLKLCCLSTTDVPIGLVHKCANTLQQLGVTTCKPKELFYDAQGNVIVYPNVVDFELSAYPRIRPVDIKSIENIVPFPCLKKLVMQNRYPYSDDVLFRGNSDTLEQLTLPIDGNTVNMLTQYQVFEGRHKVLRLVNIGEAPTNSDLTHVAEAATNVFFGDLLATAQILIVDSELVVRSLIAAAQVGYTFKHVRKLDLTWIKPSLFDIMQLLKGFPALSKLTCGLSGLGWEFDHISTDELPDYVISTFENVGKSLLSWCTMTCNSYKYRERVKCVLLLALVCPKLGRVRLEKIDVPSFKDGIIEVLESEPYSKYAPLLNRLLEGVYWL